jgi:hypothetical protein
LFRVTGITAGRQRRRDPLEPVIGGSQLRSVGSVRRRSITSVLGNIIMSHRTYSKLILSAVLAVGTLSSVAAQADSTTTQANFERFATRQLALTDAAISQEMQRMQQATGQQRDIEAMKMKQLVDRRQQQIEMLEALSQQISQAN